LFLKKSIAVYLVKPERGGASSDAQDAQVVSSTLAPTRPRHRGCRPPIHAAAWHSPPCGSRHLEVPQILGQDSSEPAKYLELSQYTVSCAKPSSLPDLLLISLRWCSMYASGRSNWSICRV